MPNSPQEPTQNTRRWEATDLCKAGFIGGLTTLVFILLVCTLTGNVPDARTGTAEADFAVVLLLSAVWLTVLLAGLALVRGARPVSASWVGSLFAALGAAAIVVSITVLFFVTVSLLR